MRKWPVDICWWANLDPQCLMYNYRFLVVLCSNSRSSFPQIITQAALLTDALWRCHFFSHRPNI